MENLLDIAELIEPELSKYRQKQVNKFYREKELDYGGEYTKMERYKNRVRVVDIFLPTLRSILTTSGRKVSSIDSNIS